MLKNVFIFIYLLLRKKTLHAKTNISNFTKNRFLHGLLHVIHLFYYRLETLELMQFLMAKNLHETLEKLENLRSFKLWPDTSNQVTSYTFS